MLFLLNLQFSSILALVLFTFFLLKWFRALSKPQKNLPPSPRKLPIIGNIHQLGSYPHRSLQSLSKKYGQLMLLHFGSVPVLVVSSVDAASEIMKTQDLIFSNRPHSSMFDKLLYRCKDIASSPYGEYWRQVRSICVLELLSNKRVLSFRHIREEETSSMIEKIRQSCSSSSSVVNLSDIFATLTNDIICRVALGRKYTEGGNGNEFKELFLLFGQLLGVFYIGDYIPWLGWVNRFNGLDAKAEKVAKEIDEFMDGVVEERKNCRKGDIQTEGKVDSKGSNLVDILLEVQRGNLTGFAVEQDTVKALILDMFAAGTDTTYTVMEWTMAELLKHPNVMQKLQTEIRQVAQGNLDIKEDDLVKMQYLKAVIKETLRLRTPVPLLVPRESTRDTKIMGYDISAGTQVLVNAWAIARDPQLWEEPEEFRPERFLNSNIDFRGSHFQLIPFGAGRRGCPGTAFAIVVNELALARLMHNFNFALPDETKPEDLDMTEITGLTAHKRLPILAVATPYSS